MNATPEMKLFSILLAWNDNDPDEGTVSWCGHAPDMDSAIEKARKESACHHNGYADECEECGCTDNDGTDICPDCGGAITTPGDIEQYMPSGLVLDSMEGVNLWAAPELLLSLKLVLGSLETVLDMACTKSGAKLSGSEETDKRIANARAVIARAEGRS